MEIAFLGMNTVRLTGKDIAVLIDPYPKGVGLPDIKLSADVTLLTSQRTPETTIPEKAGMVIDGPGEYELKGTTITAVPARLHIDEPTSPAMATIYAVVVDDIKVLYLGNIAPKLSNDQIAELGQPDVLVIPVGGTGLTLDATSASEIISQLEPKIVVPTHFQDEGVKYEMPQDSVDVFLKELGATAEPQARLRVTTKDLPIETTVALLARQGA